MIKKFDGRLTRINFLNSPSTLLMFFFTLKRESDRNSLVTSKSSRAVVHYADSVINF